MTTPDELAELASSGFLPSRADLNHGVVELAALARHEFRETWYDEMVATVPDTELVTVDLASFTRAQQAQPTGPLRLIAHVSRCGSTLLSNLLSLRSTTMVVKEPDFVTDVARGIALARTQAERQVLQELLMSLLQHTSRTAERSGRLAVVKVTSWTVPIVEQALSGAHDITWLLQSRRPDDVVSSNLASPPSWGNGTPSGLPARRDTGTEGPGADDVDLYCAVWSRAVATFTDSTDTAYRVLEFEDLRNDLAGSLTAAERWFGIEADRLPPGFADESTRYSKGRPTERFDPGGTHHRSALEPAVRARVAHATAPAHAALLACSAMLVRPPGPVQR